MGVFLEGTRVDKVSTTAYQVVPRSYTLLVTDKQLTVRLQDLGGADRWAEIQALTVTRVGSPLIVQVDAAVVRAVDDGDSLTDVNLRPIVDEAIARWAAAGASAEVLAAMANASLVIADLPRNYLGEAVGNTVYLSRDAAQRGWFVDLTPSLDEEFASLDGRNGRRAVDPRALDRVDLLTVVEHELGHLAGLDDLDPFATDLMSGSLSAGTRRLPGKSQVDAILGQQRLDDWL